MFFMRKYAFMVAIVYLYLVNDSLKLDRRSVTKLEERKDLDNLFPAI